VAGILSERISNFLGAKVVESIDASDLTWAEYGERAPVSLVLLPVGSLEQHGLHLPLDTDTAIAFEIARRLAQRAQSVVLPPIAYGARSLARSGGGDVFAGTTNLSALTLTSLVRDIVQEQIRHGVRRMAIILGHGENDPFVIEGVYEALPGAPHSPFHAVVIGWWQVLSEEDLISLFPDGFCGWDREHAARIETALMLAIAPERVRRDRITQVDATVPQPWTRIPQPAGSVPAQGALSDPRGGSVEEGNRLLDLIVERVARICTEELQVS
jgi:creatinine amidohydrolase